MKTIKFWVLFFLGVFLCGFSLAGWDVLVLKSGAELQGNLHQIRASTARFEPRWSETITDIPLWEIEAVFLGSDAATDRESHGDRITFSHRITFSDGDRLTGTLAGRTENTLSLRLDGGTVLEVLQDRVQQVETLPGVEDLLLEDPMKISLWQGQDIRPMHHAMPQVLSMQSTPVEMAGSWFFPPGSGSVLFRKLGDLPNRFLLEYAIRPQGVPFMVTVVAFGQHPRQRGVGSMQFMHQNVHIQSQIFQEGPGADSLVTWREQHDVPAGEWQRFQVFVDRTLNKAWMYLNGQALREWPMVYADAEKELTGRWLGVQVQHNAGGIQIAGLELTAWNGDFPPRLVETFERPKMESLIRGRRANEAEVHLRAHSDRLTLRVREVTATHVVAGGDDFVGEVRLPRGMVQGLRFPWMQRQGRAEPALSIDLDTPILQLRGLQEGGRP